MHSAARSDELGPINDIIGKRLSGSNARVDITANGCDINCTPNYPILYIPFSPKYRNFNFERRFDRQSESERRAKRCQELRRGRVRFPKDTPSRRIAAKSVKL